MRGTPANRFQACNGKLKYWPIAGGDPICNRVDKRWTNRARRRRYFNVDSLFHRAEIIIQFTLAMAKLRRTKRHLSKKIVFGTILSMLTIGFLAISLSKFIEQIPTLPTFNNTNTEAIVVLTGGSSRLEEGLSLLAQNKAKKLFVSGVYRGVDVRRLLALSQGNPEELVCCVKLGYAAVSTQGNAAETKAWIDFEGFRTIRLVTSSYHMPRSIKEFSYQMPDVTVIPHAVFPKQFKLNEWWRWPGTANLLLTEYIKFLMSSLRHLKEQLSKG